MKAIALIPMFILPTLHAAKNKTSKLEQPKAVQKAKTSQKASFNAFRGDRSPFDSRNRAFENEPMNDRADRFPEAYNPWIEDAARAKAAFDY